MTAGSLERFRKSVLFLLRRDVIDLSEGKLPQIMAEKPQDSITTNLSRDQKLFAEIFGGSVEIWESQEALQDIETYLSRNPYSRLGVDKHRYLRYHVTNYLNEVYILQERLRTFTTTLLRKYRKNAPADLAAISAACEQAVARLSTFVAARGVHVHERRFTNPQLHKLAGLEILRKETHDNERFMFGRIADRAFREQRTHWKKLIGQHNLLTDQVLDAFFEALHPVLFRDDGELRRPLHWPETPN